MSDKERILSSSKTRIPCKIITFAGSIRSYLSYLVDENKLKYEFKDNKMLWKQVH